MDGDGLANAIDLCPAIYDETNRDTDNDEIGDACDTDDDNDGWSDSLDNCPLTFNPLKPTPTV